MSFADPASGSGTEPAATDRAGEESIGLCSTCNNAAACTYRARRGFDALFCEMFDNDVSFPGSVRDRRRMQQVQTVSRQTPEPAPQYANLGLCATCENRETCVYPRPEGGVWHCEEFR